MSRRLVATLDTALVFLRCILQALVSAEACKHHGHTLRQTHGNKHNKFKSDQRVPFQGYSPLVKSSICYTETIKSQVFTVSCPQHALPPLSQNFSVKKNVQHRGIISSREDVSSPTLCQNPSTIKMVQNKNIKWKSRDRKHSTLVQHCFPSLSLPLFEKVKQWNLLQ